MSEQPSSETRLTWLRKMATEQCPFLIDQSDLLALVECAEAIQQWRAAKSAAAENDAYTAATAALRKLESL